ncbi:hypothetical protein IGI39_003997 [Enterococcus sp. AZ135]|uniref:hypothetical protein n=1 Tax=unclassified Enterococcus TaxID=2608891 RepID=UPI003F214388
MEYLTFEEFKELTGREAFKKERFTQFLPKASSVLDHVTNHFYQLHDLAKDPIGFRVRQFKLALCSQIIYFDELDADTFEGLNKAPQTVRIGATTISNSSRYNAGGANESKSLVADDIYIYLEGTGVLYRGCPVC